MKDWDFLLIFLNIASGWNKMRKLRDTHVNQSFTVGVEILDAKFLSSMSNNVTCIVQCLFST